MISQKNNNQLKVNNFTINIINEAQTITSVIIAMGRLICSGKLSFFKIIIIANANDTTMNRMIVPTSSKLETPPFIYLLFVMFDF